MTVPFLELQSGFLGKASPNLIKPQEPDVSAIVKSAMVGGRIIKAIPQYYHQGVEDIVKEYEADPTTAFRFEFIERVIKAAFDAFGVESLLPWFKMQKESPYLSSLHKSFLIETLNFIDGAERNVNIGTWRTLLKANPITPQDRQTPFPFDLYLNVQNEGLSDSRYRYHYQSLSDTFTLWMSRPTGPMDLIRFLEVVFGDRNATSR